MQNRSDSLQFPGGDTVQMLALKKYLERMSIQVEVSFDLRPNLTNVDVVHLFNLVRVEETWYHFRNAKRQGRKVALSSIFWDFSELETKRRRASVRLVQRLVGKDGAEALKALARAGRSASRLKAALHMFFHGYQAKQREVLQGSDIVMPNSYLEADMLTRCLGKFACRVVVNGIDPDIFSSGDPGRFNCKYGIPFARFALCVGTFSECKNQLGLLRALKGSGIPLVFIGRAGPRSKWYLQKCLQERDQVSMVFLPPLPQEELADAYAASEVHVLPSWVETTSLVSLEAAALGCNVVVTNRGCTREYFQDLALYCEPEDSASMRLAVEEAFNHKPDGRLQIHIRSNFTWDRAAQETLAAYESLL